VQKFQPLAWDASPDTTVTSYKVYSGRSPGSYNASINVGNILDYIFTVTAPGAWYWAITAVSPTGESGFTNEMSGTYTDWFAFFRR
jgi:hypothetical protein